MLSLRLCPEQHVSVACPHRLHLLRLLRSLRIDERHQRLQGWITPILITEHCAVVAYIVHCSLSIPKHGAVYVRQLGVQRKLSRHLIYLRVVHISKLRCALNVFTDIQRTCRCVAVPPLYQCLIVGCGMTNLPIQLWHTIVNPSVVHPQQYVGIKVVIVLCTFGKAAHLYSIAFVAIDAKRRYAELHPRLQTVDGFATLFYEYVHIVATPVLTIADAIAVRSIFAVVWYLQPSYWVRIEIVIHMYAVNVVTLDDVVHHLYNILAVLAHTWIKNEESVVREHTSRIGHCYVFRVETRSEFSLCTIWVQPSVQLHATLVALVDHPLQWVPVRLRCLTLYACKEAAPRLNITLIESIALGTHLEEDSVHAILLQLVELIGQCLLHLLGRHTDELPVHALNPRSAKLTLFRRVAIAGSKQIGTENQQCQEKDFSNV